MTQRTSGAFPAVADSWLVPDPRIRALAVGRPSLALAGRLLSRGAEVTLVDVAGSTSGALGASRIRRAGLAAITAATEALPFQPCSFDAVVIAWSGESTKLERASAEFARVLAPGGHLVLVSTVRDDSVPWVRRLARVLQAYDPDLMSTRLAEPTTALGESSYFPAVEQHTFRMWVPITRDGMFDMVSSAPKLARLGEPHASRLLEQVGAIYDVSARDPEPLALPYAVRCWRAEVDHSEFTSQLDLPATGLQINL